MTDGIAKLLRLKAWTDDEILDDLRRRGPPSVRPAVLALHGMTVLLVVFLVAMAALGGALLEPAVDWARRPVGEKMTAIRMHSVRIIRALILLSFRTFQSLL